MFKTLLLQLMRAYIIKITYPKQEKKQYSHYFIAVFSVMALILLMAADYIFIYHKMDYMIYVKNLLTTSIILLWLAVMIKLVSLWLNRKKRQKELSETQGLSSIINDFLPVAISTIPMNIILYVIWTKIQTRLSGKKERWQNAIRRFLL